MCDVQRTAPCGLLGDGVEKSTWQNVGSVQGPGFSFSQQAHEYLLKDTK